MLRERIPVVPSARLVSGLLLRPVSPLSAYAVGSEWHGWILSGKLPHTFCTTCTFPGRYRPNCVESDGLERTGLHALTATDTGSLANLVRHSTLVAVYAHHDHSAVFRSFRPELDDSSRTGLDAGTTSRTAFFVYLGQSCFRIDGQCTKLARRHTITTSQATECACRLSCARQQLHTATAHSVVIHHTWPIGTSPVTTHNSHFRGAGRSCKPQNSGYFSITGCPPTGHNLPSIEPPSAAFTQAAAKPAHPG